MSRRDQILMEIPRRAEPMTFAVDRALDLHEVQFMRMDPLEFRRQLKRSMAAELAHYIAEKTQFLDVSDEVMRMGRVRVQITFNDRGTYENWLPVERGEGRREGREATLASLPYGMDPRETFE
jgi:hypothetical protein